MQVLSHYLKLKLFLSILSSELRTVVLQQVEQTQSRAESSK